jgi:NADPH:quinone reductase-like Zn-dependent oxidoreductase
MHKIVIHAPGGYGQLKWEEHPDPTPGPGEVLVETTASGVNYADCCVRFGVYSSAKKYVGWPITPGFEFAGVVRQLGDGVSSHSIGQRVLGLMRFGAYATQVVVPAGQVFAVPRGWTLPQAGGFSAVFLTAYHALFQCVSLRPGMTILIHSAAGGVGSAMVQLARLAHCRTIGIVGSSHKVEYARSLGCDVVVDKSRESLWRAVEAAAPGGVDVACDAIGPATLWESYRHLRATGRLITYGFSSMLPNRGGRLDYLRGLWGMLRMPRFNPLSMVNDNKGVIAFNLSFLFDQRELLQEAMTELLQWAEAGRVQPLPLTVYPLAEAGKAHAALESGQTTGKLVLENPTLLESRL